MKKYFIVSDVHSFYNEMMAALNKAGFDVTNEDHIFVSLGDLLDRGPDPVKCLNFVNSLPNNRKVLICGNHEDLLEEAICRREFWWHDEWNGTNETCYKLFGTDWDLATDEEICDWVKYDPRWLQYLSSLKDYYELGNNIFVHGWVPISFSEFVENGYHILKERIDDDWRNGDWKKARWFNGMEKWLNGTTIPGKTIYCGHYHASWGNSRIHEDGKEFLDDIETFYVDPETGMTEPHANHHAFKDNGIVALDACTVVSGFVNCEVIEYDSN